MNITRRITLLQILSFCLSTLAVAAAQTRINADITMQCENHRLFAAVLPFFFLFIYLFILFFREALPIQTLTVPPVD